MYVRKTHFFLKYEILFRKAFITLVILRTLIIYVILFYYQYIISGFKNCHWCTLFQFLNLLNVIYICHWSIEVFCTKVLNLIWFDLNWVILWKWNCMSYFLLITTLFPHTVMRVVFLKQYSLHFWQPPKTFAKSPYQGVQVSLKMMYDPIKLRLLYEK